jgi:hypothetical protein
MTVTEAITETVSATVESIELPAVLRQFPLQLRCRVCRNDQLRTKVNDMLATGISYAMILRALQKDNDHLDTPDRATIDSIRNHTKRHFPVQNVAKATYRRILERRAQENGVDFVKGVATAITPMAFFETVMVKGYETLVDSGTKVDVGTGMIAAARLQALIESRASATRIIDLRLQMGRIIDAVHSSVPEELWPEILHKIGGPVPADTPADEFEDCDHAEDEYDSVVSAKTDEDCWTATALIDSPVEGRRAPTRTIEAPSPVIRAFTPKQVKDENDF